MNQFLIYILAPPSKRKKQLLQAMFERDDDSADSVGLSDVTTANHVTGKYYKGHIGLYPRGIG